jgi:hypothetical protein
MSEHPTSGYVLPLDLDVPRCPNCAHFWPVWDRPALSALCGVDAPPVNTSGPRQLTQCFLMRATRCGIAGDLFQARGAAFVPPVTVLA